MRLDDMIIERCLESENLLAPYACKTADAVRIREEKNKREFNVRPAFFRDADRILHSTAYTRYMDKTQVFSLFNNDMITHRGLHVQFVSKIARTIGRALKLNEDLIEAIALGHDLGHVPFGHLGERALNKVCVENDLGLFLHNVQSVRVLHEIENKGKGLNVTLQVLDGILCHNGEMLSRKYEPDYDKTCKAFLKEYKRAGIEPGFSKTIRPMTLEGCVVRVSDVIAYIGRDIEDAILVKLITRSDIPDDITSVLGNKNSTIIDALVEDLIANSYEKPYLEFSKETFTALRKLLDFNYKKIYSNPKKEDKEEKFEELFAGVFRALKKEIGVKGSDINTLFIKGMNKGYTNGNSSDKIIVDFIAGMTDKFFIDQYKKLYLPKTFDLTIEQGL